MSLNNLSLPLSVLEEIANEIRIRIIQNSNVTKTPHLGSCLSCVDILVSIYFHVLKIDVDNPKNPERDRFILSKGHAAPALFQVLAQRGFYQHSIMDDYGQDGSIFAEHPPTPENLPGIEAATGSLGHGLPMGLGMALAARHSKLKYRVIALVGDGECNEGSIWECAQLSVAQKVDNLCAVIDCNKWQATDRSQKISGNIPLIKKWEAFGWQTVEIDGNNMEELTRVLKTIPLHTGKPTAIIANTIKGKGVNFMEDDNNWHYKIPNFAEVEEAIIQLRGVK